MKRLLFSFAIMLFASAAATTAWGEASEQETKDFIVATMNKCDDPKLKEFQFKGANLHMRWDGWSYTIPIDKLKYAFAWTEYVEGQCAGSEGKCMELRSSKGEELFSEKGAATGYCPQETVQVLVKAFNHLIGIYKAQRPKPLFE